MIKILEDNDIIQADDLVRQLEILQEGQSDYIARNATYGGSPVNRLGWIPAKYLTPYWVGKTVKAFHNMVELRHEFIRGKVPLQHLERLTREEVRLLEYGWKLKREL
jgi:hypothetical protein